MEEPPSVTKKIKWNNFRKKVERNLWEGVTSALVLPLLLAWSSYLHWQPNPLIVTESLMTFVYKTNLNEAEKQWSLARPLMWSTRKILVTLGLAKCQRLSVHHWLTLFGETAELSNTAEGQKFLQQYMSKGLRIFRCLITSEKLLQTLSVLLLGQSSGNWETLQFLTDPLNHVFKKLTLDLVQSGIWHNILILWESMQGYRTNVFSSPLFKSEPLSFPLRGL